MTDKAIRVLSFSGKHEDWRMWKSKYKARATMKKWIKVMEGTETAPKESDTLDPTNDADKIAARQANEDGYADILMSMDDEIAFSIVDEARTTELPNGSLAKAWKDLHAKYEPPTNDELVQLKKEFNATHLESGENPEDFIIRLESLNRRIKGINSKRALDTDDLLIHAVANLTEEYDHVIPGLEQAIGATTDALTIEKLKTTLKPIYTRIKKRHGGDEHGFIGHEPDEFDIPEGHGLMCTCGSDECEFAQVAAGKFKGRCYKCGQFGHTKNNCPKNKDASKPNAFNRYGKQGANGNARATGNTRRFSNSSMICGYCGRRGHNEANCWKKRDDLQHAKAFDGNPNADFTDDVMVSFSSDIVRELQRYLLTPRFASQTEYCPEQAVRVD